MRLILRPQSLFVPYYWIHKVRDPNSRKVDPVLD